MTAQPAAAHELDMTQLEGLISDVLYGTAVVDMLVEHLLSDNARWPDSRNLYQIYDEDRNVLVDRVLSARAKARKLSEAFHGPDDMQSGVAPIIAAGDGRLIGTILRGMGASLRAKAQCGR